MEKISIPNEVLFNQVSELLESGSEVRIPTKGSSMLPFIRGGKDCVVLKKSDSFKTGDIVLARIEGRRYVLHRIWGIDDGIVTLMGDGNLIGKEECSIKDIKGTLEYIIRPNGKAIDVNTRCFRTKSLIWRQLLPIRRYILAANKYIFHPFSSFIGSNH